MRTIFIFLFLTAQLNFATEVDKSKYKMLYLVRHAKSSDSDSTLNDFDRPLNDRGFENAPAMGKRLKQLGVSVNLIVSSPSKRTVQTIEPIAKQLDYKIENIQWDSTIYRSTSLQLLAAIHKLDNSIHAAMFVGHNPSITQMANFLQRDTVFSEVPTCGVVAIRFLTNDWTTITHKRAELIFFERPERN